MRVLLRPLHSSVPACMCASVSAYASACQCVYLNSCCVRVNACTRVIVYVFALCLSVSFKRAPLRSRCRLATCCTTPKRKIRNLLWALHFPDRLEARATATASLTWATSMPGGIKPHPRLYPLPILFLAPLLFGGLRGPPPPKAKKTQRTARQATHERHTSNLLLPSCPTSNQDNASFTFALLLAAARLKTRIRAWLASSK